MFLNHENQIIKKRIFGKLFENRRSFKLIMKPLMASKVLKERDYRDWKKIEEWTKRL